MLQDIIKIRNISYKSRLEVLKVALKHSGAHIGGIFSIIDFLTSYYYFLKKNNYINYKGIGYSDFQLVFSKGHCYLAQLAVLDTIYNKKYKC